MSRMMKIDSITDAKTFVSNSGVADWEWGDKASAEGFAQYVRDNCDYIDRYDYNDTLRAYLISEGEDPSLYGI